MDCVLMKFLMLCILACVNFPSIGMLAFFFKGWSSDSCRGGGRLRVDDGSRLITLSDEGVAISSRLASDARKPLPLCDKVGLDSEIDSVCRSLDAGALGGFTMIVSIFLTENR